MSDRCRARVIRVRVDRHTAVLAAAAAVDDTTLLVRDAGDLAAESGTLLADDDAGTFLDYSSVTYVEDDDASDLTSADTITLAAPLTVALDEGAELSVWDVDEVLADYIAICVPEDDEDAVVSGEPIRATIPPKMQDDLPVGSQPGDGVRVVLEYDDDADEWSVVRFVGSARGIRFEADDVYTLTGADITRGTATVPLTHKPIDESVKLWWRTVAQEPTEYTVNYDAQTITLPLADFVAAGDRVWVHYAYRRGLAKLELAPVNFTVVGTAMAHGFNNTSVAFPAGTQDGDLFLYACITRTTATNTCADSRATLWVDEVRDIDTVRIWRGTVSSPGTPLVVSATDLGGVQEDAWGLIVIRPDEPADWDPAKVADSGEQGSGSIPSLSGVSGAVGVGFSYAGIGGTTAHDWGTPWTGFVDDGTYARVSFVTQVGTTIAATPAITTDVWRGFALGVGLA